MKRFPFSAVVSLFVTTFTTYSLLAQNVGVGTASPDYRLHVRLAGSSLLKLDNATPLSAGVTNDVFFKTGLYYTGLWRCT